jgi:arylformamidase
MVKHPHRRGMARGVLGGLVAVLAAGLIIAAAAWPLARRYVSAGAAATTRTREPAPSNVLAANTVARLNIRYAAHDAALNTLDLYAPRDAKNAPTLLFVHGGEWSRGDKQPVSYKPKFFNERGVIFISTNYRLSPAAPHPAQVDDVAEAVRWVREHSAEYGGDPAKIVLLGHSAGCHLVSYVGLNPEPLAKVGLKPSDLKGVVAWSGGMYDLPDRCKAGGMYAPFIKATFGESEDAQRAGSPMSYVKNAQGGPAFLVASTDEERAQASRDASARLLAAINAAGGSARPALLAGRTHRGAIEQLGAPDDTTGAVLMDFIKAVTR